MALTADRIREIQRLYRAPDDAEYPAQIRNLGDRIDAVRNRYSDLYFSLRKQFGHESEGIELLQKDIHALDAVVKPSKVTLGLVETDSGILVALGFRKPKRVFTGEVKIPAMAPAERGLRRENAELAIAARETNLEDLRPKMKRAEGLSDLHERLDDARSISLSNRGGDHNRSYRLNQQQRRSKP